MKKLDWYFNFIEVKNEGWKRIVLVSITFFVLFMISYWISLEFKIYVLQTNGSATYADIISTRHWINYFQNARNICVLMLFGGVIGFSVIMGIIRWIKEGFRKE
tara:strand:- start:199 stop:510 length:312 start_codon:yes stop_codon:yes gene_type:complete